MLKALVCCSLLSFSLLPCAAVAEPIKLKLSYFTSDAEVIYRSGVKPFVDSVNAAANGLLEIDVYASGSLEKATRAKCNWCWMMLRILPSSIRL